MHARHDHDNKASMTHEFYWKRQAKPNGNGMAAETNATQRNAMQAKTLKHPQKRSMQGNAFEIVKHTNKLSNQEMAINVSMAYKRKRLE